MWVFGEDWCDLWKAFDVLASTASILNLCVISLDRCVRESYCGWSQTLSIALLS